MIGTAPTITRQRCATRLEWLRARHPFIGASESAIVLGRSPWSSPFALHLRKKAEPEDAEGDAIQQCGHALEPLIAKLFREASGVEVHDPGEYTIYRNEALPWLSCTPDRLTIDGDPVELKLAMYESAAQWKHTVPLAYQIQVQHQLAVLDRPKAYIAVLCNLTSLRWHEVPRHQAFIDRLAKRTREFWERSIVGDERPVIDDSEATGEALGREFPRTEGTLVELDDTLAHLGARWDHLQRIENRAGTLRRGIANRLKDAMGSARLGRLADGTGFQWSGDEGSRRFTRHKKEIRDE